MAENSSLCEHVDHGNFQVTFIGIALCLIITSQSLLTVTTILRSRRLHANQYIFIVSLSFADIVLAVSSVGLRSFYSFVTSVPLNNAAYLLFFTLNSAAIAMTAVHMGIIAIDRYLRIAHPFYYMRHGRTEVICKILACVWAASAFNVFLPFVSYINLTCVDLQPPIEYCVTNAVLVLINIFVVTTCYFKKALIAIKHKRSAVARRLQNQDINTATVFRNNTLTVMKSVKFFVTVCGVYIVCTLLPFLVNASSYFNTIPNILDTMMSFLFPVHSVLNFVILCIMYKQFFTELKNTLAGAWRCFSCYRYR